MTMSYLKEPEEKNRDGTRRKMSRLCLKVLSLYGYTSMRFCNYTKGSNFLARLYESTESYCCHFEVGVGLGVTF